MTTNINNLLNRVYIVSCGKLGKLSAVDLGVVASKAAINRSKINPDLISECFFGNVLQANLGQAPAKQVAIYSGLSDSTPCTTVNKVCASGMKAIIIGTQSIQLKINESVLSGGMESMSNAWYGSCAENTAKQYDITREQQDEHCIQSYQRAAKAWENGWFKEEIAPVEVIERGKKTVVDEDEEYKKLNPEKIKQLKGAFEKNGTVTAGNASKINDGASAVVLSSEQFANQNNLEPKAEIIAYADAACDPKLFTVAPSLAIKKVLKAANMELKHIDLFELNEAFSVVSRILGLDPSKCNIWGGAVALGHPIGSSGCRIVVALVNQLKKGQIGLASVCNGGGGASAIIIKKL